ncbi:LysR substrate-binding domain-containing protein [uncultured Pseudodesulfovibrio sp.]|uniref:LysR substrate-binding domain-containing protein n=1 Tax=uncultured Pseudodesulfovibrio sp. TaxID=2035858 RepID=UPI0029C66F7D|nr:LysR substrate-binding domain-containing protein [uncultured Pseudodesulfovibrio sp.]
MIKSDDMLFMVAISCSASLAAAARMLNVTPPAVTQRLQSLESRLGVQLVERGGGLLVLTNEGDLLARRSKGILNDVDKLIEELQKRKGVVSGHLYISGPTGFGRRYIAPVVREFRTQFPQVNINLELSDNPIALKPNTCDIIIHIGELRSQPYKMITLAPNDRILCASPNYLSVNGTPRTPHDLVNHDCLTLRENDEDVTLWRFHVGGKTETVRITEGISSNDGDVILDWALSGLGIILRSEWDVADALASGRLIRLLPDWGIPDASVVALLGLNHRRTARMRMFLEALRQAFTPPPWR